MTRTVAPSPPAPLPAAALRRRFDITQLPFETTLTVEDVPLLFGQTRAADAMRLAIGMERDGYNLFVMGPPGSGKRTMAMQFMAERAPPSAPPADWAYVNNFEEPTKPWALRLPAGAATRLKQDLTQLIDELRTAIPAVFESDEYRSRESQLASEFSERHDQAFAALSEEAASRSVAVVHTPTGFSIAATKDGEVMSQEDFERLPQAEQERIRTAIVELKGKLEQIVHQMIEWRREWRSRLKQLNREMTLFAVGHLMGELKQRHAALPRVVRYLETVERDLIESADDFRRAAQPSSTGPDGSAQQGEPSFRRYSVNVLVDNGNAKGVPVVMADHPTYYDLLGRVDHLAQFGTLVTDFGLIKPGALHRANGGCLLIDAHKLLMQPFAWEALKRALLTREIRIESLAESYSLVSTISLAPEPIALDVKVALLGDRTLYYLLCQYDAEFAKLFKVVADFDDHYDNTAENVQAYARLIATIARRQSLLPIDRAAVGRVIEEAARTAGDSLKLAASVGATSDLLSESDHYAREGGREYVTAADVERALIEQRTRADRVHRSMHEAILRGTLMIDTSGMRVGQINALSVFELGDFAFAEPTRITATTRIGEGQVIDVQREIELGGAIHSKGVLILGAFIASRYSQKRPHSLAASLVFEQTYGRVEGDSASLAELCALLSSLADVPLRQSFAVTGSVNQLGEVQAIGAVNEKVEGFFDICLSRGLTGEHAVLIPASNVDHLMLKREVVEAAESGRFNVYAVRTVDQAMELLTGVAAGMPDGAGNYPESSVNGRAAHRLRELADRKLSFMTAALAVRGRGPQGKPHQ